jgi:hypothetical protein
MKRKLTIVALLLVAAACGKEDAPPADAPVFEPAFSFLSKGDMARGRAAFVDLKCFTCHRVTGDSELDEAGLPGPNFGSLQAGMSPNNLADAIVVPGHLNADSSMSDYSNTMTVRQLIDLIAFIKSLPEQSVTTN